MGADLVSPSRWSSIWPCCFWQPPCSVSLNLSQQLQRSLVQTLPCTTEPLAMAMQDTMDTHTMAMDTGEEKGGQLSQNLSQQLSLRQTHGICTEDTDTTDMD